MSIIVTPTYYLLSGNDSPNIAKTIIRIQFILSNVKQSSPAEQKFFEKLVLNKAM